MVKLFLISDNGLITMLFNIVEHGLHRVCQLGCIYVGPLRDDRPLSPIGIAKNLAKHIIAFHVIHFIYNKANNCCHLFIII